GRAWTRAADGRLLLVGDEAKSRGEPGRAPAAVMHTDSGAIRPLWREGVEGKQQLTVDDVSLASSFSPDGRLLALFPSEAATRLGFWDVTTGRRVRTFPRRFRELYSARFTSDGRRLVTKSRAPERLLSYAPLELWDLDTGRRLFMEPIPGLKDYNWLEADGRLAIFHSEVGLADAAVVEAATGTLLGRGRVADTRLYLIVPAVPAAGWCRPLREW